MIALKIRRYVSFLKKETNLNFLMLAVLNRLPEKKIGVELSLKNSLASERIKGAFNKHQSEYGITIYYHHRIKSSKKEMVLIILMLLVYLKVVKIKN